MSRWPLIAALAALAALLVACGLSPEMQAAIETVRQMEAQGRITAEQAKALIAGLEAAGSHDIGGVALETLRGVIDLACLWFFGTTLRRGLAAKRAPAA